MTYREALEELMTKAVIRLWPETATVLGLSRPGVYAAAQRGDIEIIQIGRHKKAVSAPLRRKLGLASPNFSRRK